MGAVGSFFLPLALPTKGFHMESTFTPDDTRRLFLEGFINTVCVGSTGRLGIVTHVAVEYGQWTACGFGLDGKGVWTSKDPTEIATAEEFYHKIRKRFYGRLSALDGFSPEEVNNIAKAVVEKLDGRAFNKVELGESFNPIVDAFAQLHEEVTSQIEAGIDDILGLGTQCQVDGVPSMPPRAEPVVVTPPLGNATQVDTDVVVPNPEAEDTSGK